MENTDSERLHVCPTWKPEEADISWAPAYSVHFLKISHGVGRCVDRTTELMFIEPGVKINGAYYRHVLLGQHLLPAIRSVAGDFFTYNAPAHRAGDTVKFLSLSRPTPDFISPSTTWNSVSSRSGVASTRTSLTEQFDSSVFDYARVRANGGHFEHKL